MPKKRVCVVVDAFSSGRFLAPEFRTRGYESVHVRSVKDLGPYFGSLFDPAPFLADVNPDELRREYEPVCIVPGAESGVELADRLCEEYGLFSNGTALSSARRNKFEMVETIRRAGLPTTEQVRASDPAAIIEWAGRRGGWPVVLKPLKSLGSDMVHLCRNPEEVASTMKAMLGGKTRLGDTVSEVLAQSFLEGDEYALNTVSLQGRHHLVNIVRYEKGEVNGVAFMYRSLVAQPYEGERQRGLIDYSLKLLDALGIRNGAAHCEVKWTPRGPVVVEVAARLVGGNAPAISRKTLGTSQIEILADAYLDPDRFLSYCGKPYVLPRHATTVFLANPRQGALFDKSYIDRIRGLRSFIEIFFFAKDLDAPLAKTVDFTTHPGYVVLCHESSDQIEADVKAIRAWEDDSMYARP